MGLDQFSQGGATVNTVAISVLVALLLAWAFLNPLTDLLCGWAQHRKISRWAIAWAITALAMFAQWGRAEWNHSLFLQWQEAYWRDVGGIAEPAKQSQPEGQ